MKHPDPIPDGFYATVPADLTPYIQWYPMYDGGQKAAVRALYAETDSPIAQYALFAARCLVQPETPVHVAEIQRAQTVEDFRRLLRDHHRPGWFKALGELVPTGDVDEDGNPEMVRSYQWVRVRTVYWVPVVERDALRPDMEMP